MSEPEEPPDQAPWTLLNSVELVAMHDRAIVQYGGLAGLAQPKCPNKTIAAAWSAELYAEASTPGLNFAGHLLFYFSRNHCFNDGNKRAGWLSCLRALERFDLTLGASQEEAEAFVGDIASGREGSIRDAGQVVQWIAERLIELPSAPAE